MMELVDGSLLTYDETMLKHRGAGLAFKNLFLGDENDIPNNYYFVLAKQESFYSPVHHHNFDQFRFVTKAGGPISILPDLDVHPGELCYHPEGVYYGPQNDGEGVKEVLVLQFGGASGQGFVSHRHLKESQEKLGKVGRFEKGKFFPMEEVIYQKLSGYRIIPKGRKDGYISIDGERVPFEPYQAEVHKGLGTVLMRSASGAFEAPGPGSN